MLLATALGGILDAELSALSALAGVEAAAGLTPGDNADGGGGGWFDLGWEISGCVCGLATAGCFDAGVLSFLVEAAYCWLLDACAGVAGTPCGAAEGAVVLAMSGLGAGAKADGGLRMTAAGPLGLGGGASLGMPAGAFGRVGGDSAGCLMGMVSGCCGSEAPL